MPWPEAARILQLRFGTVGAQPQRTPAAVCEHKRRSLSLAQLESRRSALSIDDNRNARKQTERLSPSRGLDALPNGAEQRLSPGIVEPGFKDALGLHLTCVAPDAPVNLVRGTLGLGAAPYRHEVGDGQNTGGGRERGLKDVGIRQVRLVSAWSGLDWGDPERAAGVPVQQRSEHTGRVEPGHTAPVDRAVGPNEGGR